MDPISPFSPKHPGPVRNRRGVALALALALALPFGMRALMGGEPAMLVAAEVDTLEAGVRLAEALTLSEPGVPMRERLKRGFTPEAGHPRLSVIPPGDETRRLGASPPLPRWVATLGVSGLPLPESTTNARRASVAATLLFCLTLLLWLLHLGLWHGGTLFALLMLIPEARDALVSYGYGATALLGTSLALIGFDRLGRPDPTTLATRTLTAALICVGLGVCLGAHPFLVLGLLAVFFVPPLVARTTSTPPDEPRQAAPAESGRAPLPELPLSLLLWPLFSIAFLIATWPSLWSATGKRLMAYLLESGFHTPPPHLVASQLVEPAADRSAQAMTALLQYIGWTPLPLLALALFGLLTMRRPVASALPLLGAILLGGALDGALNGARLSLWPFLWAPTLWLVLATWEHVERAPARHGARARLPRWLRLGRDALLIALLLEFTGVRDALRARTAVELDFGVPLSLFDAEARAELSVVTVETPDLVPAFSAMRDHLEWGIASGDGGPLFTQRPLPFPTAAPATVFRGVYSRLTPPGGQTLP